MAYKEACFKALFKSEEKMDTKKKVWAAGKQSKVEAK